MQLPVMTAQGVGLRGPSVPFLTASLTSLNGALGRCKTIQTENTCYSILLRLQTKLTCEHKICNDTAEKRAHVFKNYYTCGQHLPISLLPRPMITSTAFLLLMRVEVKCWFCGRYSLGGEYLFSCSSSVLTWCAGIAPFNRESTAPL